MKRKIKKFLEDNNFLPLNKWKSFKIVYKVPKGIQEEKDCLKYIKGNVLDRSGLYVFEKEKKIIYVGKGNPLFNRIRDHYILSYRELSGDDKYKTYHRFSSSHLGSRLKVYWIEQEDEKIRQIIEKMLDYVLEPEFNSFRENIRKQIKRIK